MMRKRCSVCKSYKIKNIVVARPQGPNAKNILLAYLCASCEEVRQKYLETKTGFFRNEIVETDNGSGVKVKKEIISMLDEVYFVCDKGYAIPYASITDFGVQKTLF
jgi:hypothetical protein